MAELSSGSSSAGAPLAGVFGSDAPPTPAHAAALAAALYAYSSPSDLRLDLGWIGINSAFLGALIPAVASSAVPLTL